MPFPVAAGKLLSRAVNAQKQQAGPMEFTGWKKTRLVSGHDTSPSKIRL
jgi:hypothetical protein